MTVATIFYTYVCIFFVYLIACNVSNAETVSSLKKDGCESIKLTHDPPATVLVSKIITFKGEPFNVVPYVFVNIKYGSFQESRFEVLTINPSAQYKYILPRFFTVQTRQILPTQFLVDVSLQPGSLNYALEEFPDIDLWPETLQICYLAWAPGSWVDGTTIKEGSELIKPDADIGSGLILSRKIEFETPFGVPGTPQVVVSVNSYDGTFVAPVSVVVANFTESSFHLRLKIQHQKESFQRWNILQITYLAWLDTSSLPFVIPQKISGEIIIKYKPSASMESSCQMTSYNIWAAYIDREGISVFQKMKRNTDSYFYLSIYRPQAYIQFIVGKGFLTNDLKHCFDPQPSIAACTSDEHNVSFPDCGYYISSPGLYEIINEPVIRGVPHAKLVIPADTSTCPKDCSGHGICSYNTTTQIPKCICNPPWDGYACESLFRRLRPAYMNFPLKNPSSVWNKRLQPFTSAPKCFVRDSYKGCSKRRCTSTGPGIAFGMPVNVLTEKANLALFDIPVMCTLTTTYDKSYASSSFPSYLWSQPVFDNIYGERTPMLPTIQVALFHDVNNPSINTLSSAACDWGAEEIVLSCVGWLQNLDTRCPDSHTRVCGGHGRCIPCGSKPSCYTCDCYAGYALDENRSCTLCEDGYIEDIADGKCLRCPYSQQNYGGVSYACSGHGSCTLSNSTVTQKVKAVCQCNQGGAWYGEACDKCDLCGKHGICTVDNTTNSQDIICQCKDRFIGKKCDECEPNNMITPDGRCIACTQECGATGSCTAEGNCVCRSGVGKYPSCNDSKESLGVGEIILLTIIITFIVVICLFGINYCIRRYIAISKYKKHKLELTRELLLDNDSAVGLISDRGFGENAKDWTIRFDAIKFGDIIGEGSVGKVYKGVYAGENVAVKSLDQGSKWDKQQFFHNFRRETRIMSHLHHPNIVRFFGVSYAPENSIVGGATHGSFLIVTELCMYSLGHLIRESIEFPKDKYNFALQIAQGIQALHNKDIIHRDLKPDNVLIDRNGTAKLCDFGVAKEFKEAHIHTTEMTLAVGTPIYMAPELSKKSRPNKKVDIYSLGITINSFFAMQEPYGSMEPTNPFILMERINNGHRPKLADNLTSELRDLIVRCWSPVPDDRPFVQHVIDVLKPMVAQA